MGFYSTKPSQSNAGGQSHEFLAAAILCLRDGRNAQAFALLSAIDENAEPAAVFALALCYLRAGDLPAAVTHMEQALRLIRTLPFTPQDLAGNSDTYKNLYRAQLEAKVYLSPMDTDFCTRFPKEAERTVLLALIHTCLLAGMNDKARRLAAGLTGPEFDAYKERLMENQ